MGVAFPKCLTRSGGSLPWASLTDCAVLCSSPHRSSFVPSFSSLLLLHSSLLPPPSSFFPRPSCCYVLASSSSSPSASSFSFFVLIFFPFFVSFLLLPFWSPSGQTLLVGPFWSNPPSQTVRSIFLVEPSWHCLSAYPRFSREIRLRLSAYPRFLGIYGP